MGYFLNNEEPYVIYQEAAAQPYFIDKTGILKKIFPLINSTEKYICITRPRRFGKTIMANLIGSFFPRHAIQEIFLIP
jgi:predicted AAA+ superfamily ATPase